MKAVNKVRLIYLPAIVLPIFVMIVSIAGLSIGYSRINKADLSAGSFERFVNPLKTMNTETQEIFFELEDHVKKDPQIFDNEQYLNDLNERLKAKDSYLIVRKNGQIQYIGKKKVSDKLIHKLPSYGNKDSDADRGFFVSRPGNYLVKQQDFKYNDGGQGSVFIMTNLGTVLPHYRNIIILLCLFVRSLILIGGTYNMYMTKRKNDKALDQLIKDARIDDLKATLPDKDNSLYMGYLRDLLYHPASADYSDFLITKFENEAEKDVSLSKMLAKIGPVLGLIGTLISMSPALVGLSTGDISGMAYNMQVVFATTVVGLVISAVGLISMQFKQRWYAKDVNNLDYVSRVLNETTGESNNEKK